MNEKQKPDLSKIEPIAKLPDDEPGLDRPEDVGAPPVGQSIESDAGMPGPDPRDEEPELDKLRRG
jgi:hypothetical protein